MAFGASVVGDAKKAGGAKAEPECKDGVIEAKAGGVVAKAPCEPEPPNGGETVPKGPPE